MVMQGIDWRKIKKLNELEEQVSPDELYDVTPVEDDIYSAKIQPYLTEAERKDAEWWAPYSRGLWRVISAVGEGKSAICMYFSDLFRYYYGRTVILDSKPRPAFGKYVPFSLSMFVNQLERIKYQTEAKSDKSKMSDEEYKEITEKGLDGDIFLTNSVWYLDEFNKYMPRQHSTAVSQTFLDYFAIWRHMDTLIMGSCTKKRDLELERLEPEVTADVIPRWDAVNGRVLVKFVPLKYVSSLGTLKIKARPKIIAIDIFKPRKRLGGLAVKDLYNTKNLQAISIRGAVRKQLKRGEL